MIDTFTSGIRIFDENTSIFSGLILLIYDLVIGIGVDFSVIYGDNYIIKNITVLDLCLYFSMDYLFLITNLFIFLVTFHARVILHLLVL